MQNWQQYPITSIDVARCNNEYFVNMIGLRAFDGEVLRKMKTVRLIGGHLGYLLVVIRLIFFTGKMDDIAMGWQPIAHATDCCVRFPIPTERRRLSWAPHAIINDGWSTYIL